MIKIKYSLIAASLSGLAIFGLSACDDKAETTGEKIDKAIEDASGKVEEAAEEVADEIDDATN